MNEFIIRKGLIALEDSQITGSLSISGSLSVNGVSPVVGTGTTNFLPKFTGTSTIGNSLIFDNGTNVLIGTTATPTPVAGVAFPFSVTSAAATRIRIDSTQTVPNSGFGLYANSVQKWSIAMFGTDSDFTIYNDALLSSAILVKGVTSNVLIGYGTSTADAGFKLDINGTARITGALRLDSTLTNGTHTYTLPSSTGTLALTSDLTGFVTLGTAQTITGTKTFTNGISIGVSGINGYSISTDTGSEKSKFTFGTKAFIFNVNSIPSFTTLTYTMPSSTGTLALTSDLTGLVTLDTAQTITGQKIFSLDSSFNGVSVGIGGGNISTNTRVGNNTLLNNTTGSTNTAIGYDALLSNISGISNTAIGFDALRNNTTGSTNTAIGREALPVNTTGIFNTAIGGGALFSNTEGSSNTAIGREAGRRLANNTSLTVASNSIFIGVNTKAALNDQSNQIVIGNDAIGAGDNSVVLGHTTITKTVLRGNVGIGTIAPSVKFEVLGGDSFISNIRILNFFNSFANGISTPVIGRSSGFAGYPTGSLLLQARSDSAGGDIVFITGATTSASERLRITSAGNVGIGTDQPSAPLAVQAQSNSSAIDIIGRSSDNASRILFKNSSGVSTAIINKTNSIFRIDSFDDTPIGFRTNDTERLRITSAGNVGIGTDTPAARLTTVGSATVIGQTNVSARFSDDVTSTLLISHPSGSGNTATITGNTQLAFATGVVGSIAERMRITSGGSMFVGALIDSAAISTFVSGRNGFAAKVSNNDFFLYSGLNTSNVRTFIVLGTGDVKNTNNSYGAISDIKLKENIEDATPKLHDLLKVKVRNFNLIGDDRKQIGVIAQELQEVFPAMIDESEDFEEVEVPQLDEEGLEIVNGEGEVVTEKQRVSKGTSTKSVKYSVFVPMLIKAIQELKTEIDSLKNL